MRQPTNSNDGARRVATWRGSLHRNSPWASRAYTPTTKGVQTGKLRLDRWRSQVRLNFSDNTAGTHLTLRSIAPAALQIAHARHSASPSRFSPQLHANARRSDVYCADVDSTLARGVAVHRVLLRQLHPRADDV